MFERESSIYQDYVKGLPAYLSAFAEPQHYQRYTWENQAVWRFIMRQLTHFFKTKAPKFYHQGLERAAIPVERIPRIEEMIQSLQEIGWGALCVNGFIPPAAFMEYNANRILPISADMRTLKHLLYTPAPDVVHEAAGHAPIVIDPEYSNFLQRIGEYGSKALSNKYDQRVYEAIRKLSIVKEYPHSTPQDVQMVEQELQKATKEQAQHPKSEAALISRFHWWTVEYGLLKGNHDNDETSGSGTNEMRMYGAGLLSSLGEGRNCLKDPKVKKIKLGVDCVETDYDITTPQPQLFYVESFKNLFPALEELANRMAFRIGGASALKRAIANACTASVVYDSGLQVSGIWSRCMQNQSGQAIYIATTGPTSLAYGKKELEGHGKDYHAHGFSSPVGRLTGSSRPLAELNERELQAMGIICGKKSRLEFTSGVVVEGTLENIMSRHGRNILMTFTNCRVNGPQEEALFQPDWGTYDMAVGESLASVFGGPADKLNYDFIKQKSDYRNLHVKYTEKEQKIFDLYYRVRRIREEQGSNCNLHELQHCYQMIRELAPDNWLLPVEMMELLQQYAATWDKSPQWQHLHQEVTKDLEKLRGQGSEIKYLIDLGLDLA